MFLGSRSSALLLPPFLIYHFTLTLKTHCADSRLPGGGSQVGLHPAPHKYLYYPEQVSDPPIMLHLRGFTQSLTRTRGQGSGPDPNLWTCDEPLTRYGRLAHVY